MTTPGGFFDQFIEDYYAECDEHLATARRVLLGLEEDAAKGPPDAGLLRELFRSLHTLKGLSGMVGDPAAERIAHTLEDSLRAAERTGAPMPPAFVDALFAGVELLGQCVHTRRGAGPQPDIDAALDALARVTPGGLRASAAPHAVPVAPLQTPSSAPAPAPPDAEVVEGVVHHFEFAPSVALTARGVGVDAVRTRLRALGTLLDAKPRVAAGGVVFDFWVMVAPGHAPDPAWSDDGLRWHAAPLGDTGTGATTAAKVAPAATPAPAPAPLSAPAAQPPVAPAGGGTVRVDLTRLDDVMRMVADLVISRSRLDDVLGQASVANFAATRDLLEETNAAMERQLRRLREGVMRIRLVPVGEVFERLRFAARDAIRESGKQVQLAFEGQTTEIDKLVVDRMLEPLLHLVRNAVSHGIETPAERLAQGKPAEGRLTLRAAAAGDRIVIDVEDDGAGIDVARVVARGRERGLLSPDAGPMLADDALLDVLCAPGLSTRDEADMTSGRGVGMDVVRSTIRALSGEIRVHTRPGAGTRFVIELPLTLMILDALLVEIAGQHMAVPQPALREILQVDAPAVVSFESNDVVPYRGGVLPLLGLARLFGFHDREAPRPSRFFVLVVGSDAAPVGLVVDRLLGLREIVVYPVADPLVALPGIAGATELGDGRVSLILDTAVLVRLAQEQRDQRALDRTRAPAARSSAGGAAARRPSLSA